MLQTVAVWLTTQITGLLKIYVKKIKNNQNK